MRHPLPLLLAATSLALVACGGDADTATDTAAVATAGTSATDASDAADDEQPDDATDADGGDEPADETPDDATGDATDDATGDAIDDATDADAPLVTGDCEDAPDPTDYVEGRIPPAIRPCELPTELVVHTIREGTGHAAEAGDTLVADYTGIRSEDGMLFDTSYTRGVPLDFPVGRGGVIQGWDEGLLGSQAGSMFKLDIPAELAYGQNPPPGDAIRAGDALTFIVEVRAVIPSVSIEDAPLDLDLDPSVGALEVTTTDLVVGDGAEVVLGSTAVAHLLLVRGDNEVVLFNSWERDDPLQIIMEEGQTLPGIFEGIQGARVGTLRAIAMPPDEAFGPDGEPSLGLPAGVDLIVVVEVVGVY
jgi:peptidylprolyl isomerase